MLPQRLFVLFALLSTGAHAQWLNHPTPGTPRTKDGKPNLSAKTPRLAGKPDLSGVWQVEPRPGEIERTGVSDVPGDDVTTFSKYFFNILADFKPEEAPLRPEAVAIMRNRPKDAEPASLRCLPHGVPKVELMGFPFKIVQTPGLIVVMYENDYTRREIYTDGRKLPDDPNPAWLGYSVGHWEGDALVVDSAGFNDKFWIDVLGHPNSESLHIQERFHRRDFGHMGLKITINASRDVYQTVHDRSHATAVTRH